MRDDYSIKAEGWSCWYSDRWGTLMFVAESRGPSAKHVARMKRLLHAVPALQESVAQGEHDLREGVKRFFLEEEPASGRSTGIYRFFRLRSRMKRACQRVKSWLEAHGNKVAVFPARLTGGFHSGFGYDCIFGTVTVHAREIRKEDGVSIVNVYSRRKDADLLWPTGMFFRRMYHRLAIQEVQAYVESLGGRVVFEQFQS